MIKILEVVDYLEIDSGITTFLKNYCENDSNISYDFMIVSGDATVIESLKINNSKVYYMPDFKINVFKFNAFLDNFFMKNKYDVVHSHTFQMDKFLFRNAKKYHKVKCISHSHSIKFSDNRMKALISKILSWNLSKYTDVCLACSKEAGLKLFNKTPFKIIYNAIDAKKYYFNEEKRNIIRKELGLENKYVIGYVANFSEGKNQQFLVECMRDLLNKRDNCILLFVGEGRYYKKVMDFVEKKEYKDKIIFMGKKENINELLFAMDTFALPSVHEGFSIAALEAEASGLPVTISKGVPSLVKIINCKSVDIVDREKWVYSILNNRIEQDNRQAANKYIEDSSFDIEVNRKILKKLYME